MSHSIHIKYQLDDWQPYAAHRSKNILNLKRYLNGEFFFFKVKLKKNNSISYLYQVLNKLYESFLNRIDKFKDKNNNKKYNYKKV